MAYIMVSIGEGENIKVTEKQEMFCQLIVNGDESTLNNYTTSYEKSYSCSYKTANSRSSKLKDNLNVQRRIEFLRKKRDEKIESRFDLKVADLQNMIADIVNDEESKDADKLKGLDMLLKTIGGYEKDNKQQATTVVLDTSGKSKEQLLGGD